MSKDVTLKVRLDLSEAKAQIEQLRAELRSAGGLPGAAGPGGSMGMAPMAGVASASGLMLAAAAGGAMGSRTSSAAVAGAQAIMNRGLPSAGGSGRGSAVSPADMAMGMEATRFGWAQGQGLIPPEAELDPEAHFAPGGPGRRGGTPPPAPEAPSTGGGWWSRARGGASRPGFGSTAIWGAAAVAAIGTGYGDTALDAAESGRRMETHDWILGALGGIPIIGGMFKTLNRAIDNAHDEPQKGALAGLAAVSGEDLESLVTSGAGLGVPHMQAASALGSRLSRGLGRSAAGVAVSLSRDLYNADPTLEKSLTTAQIQALAGAVNAESSAALGRAGYDRGIAAALAAKDPLAAEAYIQTHGGKDNAADLSQLAGNVETGGFRVQHLGSIAEQASYAVQSVTARGGNAAQIGGAIAGEIGSLNAAASGLRDLIAAAEKLGDTTEGGKARLEGYRSQLAAVNAQVSELRYTQTRIASDEALDVAGTGSAVAASNLSRRLLGARRGDATVFQESASAVGDELDALNGELARPGLKPEDYRRLKRAKAAKDAEAMGLLRQEGDYLGGEGQRFGDLSYGYAGTVAAGTREFGSSSDLARANRSLSAAATERLTGARAFLGLMESMPELYSDEDIARQRNAVIGAQLDQRRAAQQASRVMLSDTDQGILGAYDVFLDRARRQGGTAAIGTTRSMISWWGGMRDARRSAYQASPNAATLSDLNQAERTLLGYETSLGAGGLDATVGTALDAAVSRQRILETNMFAGPGVSRRGAAMDTMAAYRSALGDANTRLAAATDPQVRRSLGQEINSYNEALSGLELNLNDGWWGRLVDRTIGAPNRSALTNVSYRDILMVGPTGNRHIGTASRDGYAQDRFDAQSGRTVKPGSVSNQASELVIRLVDARGTTMATTRMEVGRGMKQTLDAKAAG